MLTAAGHRHPDPPGGVVPGFVNRTGMPEVYVHAAKGRTAEQKRGLLKDITDAVVRNFGVPADAVTVTIVEADLDLKSKGGVLFSER